MEMCEESPNDDQSSSSKDFCQTISRVDFESIDPYNFEQLVADIWHAKGYDTTVRSKSGDEGIDVEAEKTGYKEVIQVKRYNIENKIGSEEVRFYATLYQQVPDANTVVLVTSGEFTKEGRDLAEKLKVETFNGDDMITEIQEHKVDLSSVPSVIDQTQRSTDNPGESGVESPQASESEETNSHRFPPNDNEFNSDKLGSECPACGSKNSIWESENREKDNSLRCVSCNTLWWNQGKILSGEPSKNIWTAHGGQLDGESGTLQEWRRRQR